jgi:hypothetical protein
MTRVILMTPTVYVKAKTMILLDFAMEIVQKHHNFLNFQCKSLLFHFPAFKFFWKVLKQLRQIK